MTLKVTIFTVLAAGVIHLIENTGAIFPVPSLLFLAAMFRAIALFLSIEKLLVGFGVAAIWFVFMSMFLSSN